MEYYAVFYYILSIEKNPVTIICFSEILKYVVTIVNKIKIILKSTQILL